MEEIRQLLGYDELSQEECATYLARNPDAASDLSPLLVDKSVLQQVGDLLTQLSNSNTGCSRDVLLHVAAVLFSNAVESEEPGAKLVASRLLLSICSLPLSSAYGVLTSSLLSSICGIFTRVIVKSLSGGGLTRKAPQQSAQSEVVDELSDGEDTMELEENAANSASQREMDASMQGQRFTIDIVALCAEICLLLSAIFRALSLFTARREEYVLESMAEVLVAAVCLGAARKDFSGAARIASATLVSFACDKNTRCMMAAYRSLLPVVTLAGRDPKLPDSVKLKVFCQEAACEIALVITRSAGGVTSLSPEIGKLRLPSASTPAAAKSPTAPSTVNSSLRSAPASSPIPSPEAVATPGSSAPAAVPIATPFACAVGLLQRLLMTAQERITPRQTLISVTVRMVTALYCGADDMLEVQSYIAASLKAPKKKGQKKGTSSSRTFRSRVTRRLRRRESGQESEEEDVSSSEEDCKEFEHSEAINVTSVGARVATILSEQRETATATILCFIVKLSRSAKLNQRSLCLDIASALLAEKWLWDRHSALVTTDDIDATPVQADVDRLIGMLIARCSDVAATVRSRALGALWDLMDTISGNSKSTKGEKWAHAELCNRIHRLVLEEGAETGQKSLITTLRELVCDEKALVRVKAIQAVGLIYSMVWPSNETLPCKEASLLFLSEEDILVVADRCSDSSVAVRKQAVLTLSQLLQSRPADSALQEAWIDAALPLVLDVESSIQIKTCQAVCDILIAGTTAPPGSAENEAVWTICCKIDQLGCSKLLKSAVSAMYRLGVIKAVNDKAGAPDMKIVLSNVRTACCATLIIDTDSGIGNADVANVYLQQESLQSDMQSLRAHDPEAVSRGAWILLESLVSEDVSSLIQNDFISADFVVKCWLGKRSIMTGGDAFILDSLDTRMLRVLASVPSGIPKTQKQLVCSKLQPILNACQCDAQGIAAGVAVLFAFSVDQSSDDDAAKHGAKKYSVDTNFSAVIVSTGILLNTIHSALHSFIWSDSKPKNELFTDSRAMSRVSADLSASGLSSALFLLGEIALLGFSVEEEEDAYKTAVPSDSIGEHGLPQFLLAESHGTFKIVIPEILVVMAQILMGRHTPHATDTDATVNSLTTSVIGAGDVVGSKVVPHKVRAQAFVTMGKLCLRSRLRARDMVNIFLRELRVGATSSDSRSSRASFGGDGVTALTEPDFECSGAHAVRSNALIVLGDLCVRFTNLVDRHVGAMAACLQDPDVLVRRHSFILLTQLLLQEYLKWRGMLLFRFLATVLDKDEDMAELSKYVLKSTLQTKYSGFIVQNFTEAIIVFNGCTGHATYQAMASIGSDGGSCAVSMDGIDLGGSAKRTHRMRVYEFMMEDVTEEQKIQITANIVQDIFSYALDFPLSLQSSKSRPSPGGSVDNLSPLESALVDAFLILQSPLLRVGSKKSALRDDEDFQDAQEQSSAGPTGAPTEESTRAAFQQAKTKVLKKLSVQHLVDHILPVVSSLKHFLEAAKSPVQRALMEYLVYLVHTNKSEVAQALSADPSLREEIEYDIKLFEREKLADKKRRQIASAEKAVQKLEISTSRKSSVRNPPGSGRGRSSEGFADRFVGQATSRLSAGEGHRRVSRGTPQLRATSASIKKSISVHRQYVSGLVTAQSVLASSRNMPAGVMNTHQSSSRSGNDIPDNFDDDYTSRLTANDSPVSPSKGSHRRWSVTIADLETDSELLAESITTSTAVTAPVAKKRGTGKENSTGECSSDSPDKKKKRSGRCPATEVAATGDSLATAAAAISLSAGATVQSTSASPVTKTEKRGRRGKAQADVLATLK